MTTRADGTRPRGVVDRGVVSVMTEHLQGPSIPRPGAAVGRPSVPAASVPKGTNALELHDQYHSRATRSAAGQGSGSGRPAHFWLSGPQRTSNRSRTVSRVWRRCSRSRRCVSMNRAVPTMRRGNGYQRSKSSPQSRNTLVGTLSEMRLRLCWISVKAHTGMPYSTSSAGPPCRVHTAGRPLSCPGTAGGVRK